MLHKLDEEITKLAQVRDLLSDAGVLAVVKHVVNRMQVLDLPPKESSRAAGKRGTGELLKGARQCVRTFEKPFTKTELATKMRAIGCAVDAPKTQLQYSMQKLLAEGVVKIVEEGGARRPTRYQTNRQNESADQSDRSSTPIASADPQLRGALLRTAYRCIEGMTAPFSNSDLAQKMRADGYTFAGDAGLSVQSAVAKFLDLGLLEIVNGGTDQPTILYGRSSR